MEILSKPGSITFSLVIATLGPAQYLGRCLDSLLRQTFKDFEVIIVDQNGDDRLIELLTSYSGRLSIRHCRSAVGVSKARNTGAALAHGRIIGFPDDDCWYAADTLARFYALFQEHPQIGAFTGRCTDGEGRLAAGADDRKAGAITKSNVWGRGVSVAIFMRRDLFICLGGFDEKLGLGSATQFQSGEETDLLLRALKAEHQLLYDPKLEVFHPLPSSKTENAVRRAWCYGLGSGRVLRKHEYGPSAVLYHLVWPVFGALLALATCRTDLARVRFARAAGRIMGWRWQPGMAPIPTPSWAEKISASPVTPRLRFSGPRRRNGLPR